MLKNWVQRWRQRGVTPTRLTARIIPRDQHPVSRRYLSPVALKTLYRLQEAGYQAFLIGGGVRDVLIGLQPKDFDVATDATPEQVKKLFGSQCQLIGRRFRLAHVRWGREIIEVATFRAASEAATSENGLVLRDNAWGSIEEDAARRDFTINAIYYHLADFSLWDFADGLQDIEQRLIRMIGDPATRYREDPVRMLRALRFAAKLDFRIEPHTGHPIPSLASLLADVSPHRLHDECQKLFSAGFAEFILPLLSEYGVLPVLFPATARCPDEELWAVAANTIDLMIEADEPVDPAWFLSALLWPAVAAAHESLQTDGLPPVPAWQKAAQIVLSEQMTRTAIPKHISFPLRDIWELQHRLETPRPRQVIALSTHPLFAAALTLLSWREQAGHDTQQRAAWWKRWQSADPGLQAELVRGLQDLPGKRTKSRRRASVPR